MPKNLGIYIHMPFCKQKCNYCDFYSQTENNDFKRYSDCIGLHMEDYSRAADSYDVDTIFIGGGTPSVMPKKFLNRVLDSVFDNFNVTDDAEITMEVNPGTIDGGTLKALSRDVVNRLSIGMQSANDNELRALGRIHDYADFEECFENARKAKFNNINVDIMYGIPEQTMRSFGNTLDKVISLRPEHISLYNLIVEPETPFYGMKDNLNLPDEDTEYEMYVYAIEKLKAAGYNQYEISNFALPGYECRHNLKYWNAEDYLGFGPAAHSYFAGRRFSYIRDIARYMDEIENTEDNSALENSPIIDENYIVSENDKRNEYVMLRMRLTQGISGYEYESRFDSNFEEDFKKYLSNYVKYGFMQYKDGFYSFTTKGMYVSNYILSAMLDFDHENTAIKK